MNARALTGDLLGSALGKALAAINAKFDPNSLENIAAHTRIISERKAAARKRIIRYSDSAHYGELMAWLSACEFAPIGGFLSCNEAACFFRDRRRQYRNIKKANHWSLPRWSARMPAYRERLMVAAYFNRHGRELWSSAAA